MLVDLAPAQDLGRLLHQEAASSDYDLNPALKPNVTPQLRPAAVLIAIWHRAAAARPEILLTQRSSQLSHHPGQVAFPGGKIDPQDHSPEAAALREAQEEVGLDPAAVRIIGRLPGHETVTGFQITPVLAEITGPFTPRPEAGEVDEVFSVPLDYLMTAANYRIEARSWRGTQRRYYTIPWGPHYIWGATARILRNIAQAQDRR